MTYLYEEAAGSRRPPSWSHEPLRRTSSPRYVGQLVRLAGGIRESWKLLDPIAVELLDLMKKGSTYTAGECVTLAKSSRQEVERVLLELLDKQVLLRGYQLKCPLCDLVRWYPLRAMDDEFGCAGCLTPLGLPLEPPVAYRLNELASRGVEQAALGVIAGVRFLHMMTWGAVSYQPGIIFGEANSVDIDVLASIDGHLCAMEYKSLTKDDADDSVADKVMGQMKQLRDTLAGTPVRDLFLHLLTQNPPKNLSRIFDRWVSGSWTWITSAPCYTSRPLLEQRRIREVYPYDQLPSEGLGRRRAFVACRHSLCLLDLEPLCGQRSLAI